MAPSIQRTLHQRKPFPSLQEQVVVNLIRTTHAVTQEWNIYLKQSAGLSPAQYNLLRILRGAQPGVLCLSEVADRLITRDPDVTRLVDGLARRGLVSRNRDTTDRRVVLVEITEAGLDLLRPLDSASTRQALSTMAGLSTGQLQALDQLLDTLRSGIEATP